MNKCKYLAQHSTAHRSINSRISCLSDKANIRKWDQEMKTSSEFTANRRICRDDKMRACVHIFAIYLLYMCARNLLRSTVVCMSVFFSSCFCLFGGFVSFFLLWACSLYCCLFCNAIDSLDIRMERSKETHTHTNRENVSYLPSFSMLFAKYGENIQILCVPRHNVYFAAILFTSMHLVGENAGGASTIDSITNPKPYPTRNIKLSNSTSIWAECKARSMKTFDCCIIYSAEMLIRFVTHCLSYIP